MDLDKQMGLYIEYCAIWAYQIYMGGEFLNDSAQRIIVGEVASGWHLVTSGVPQGSVPGPVLFYIFACDLDARVVCILSKITGDTELWGADDSLEKWGALQRDLNTLEHWVIMNNMINTGQCWVLHLGWIMPGTGKDWSQVAESSSTEGTCGCCDSSSARASSSSGKPRGKQQFGGC